MKTYAIRYMFFSPSFKIWKEAVARVESELDLERFAKKLARTGFRHRTAGYDRWIMPSAIMSVDVS